MSYTQEEIILLRDIYDRVITESEAAVLTADILHRTRNHPDIVRGASVRGAIALNQVMLGFATLENRLLLSAIEKAAMITLPSRIEVIQDSGRTAEDIIRPIVNAVLYSDDEHETEQAPKENRNQRKLSFDEFLAALQDLSLSKALEDGVTGEDTENGNFQVVPQTGDTGGLSNGNMEKDSRFQDWAKWYPELEQTLKDMLGQLEQKRIDGDISESDYRYQKKKLEDMLNAASYLDSDISDEELANTVMELMEAGDRQWQKELEFQDMYVYYHIRESQAKDGLSTPKQNWYALKVIVDFLEKQNIVDSNEAGTGFTLTEKAIELMLKNILSGTARSGKTRLGTYTISSKGTERRQDTRKYASGDVFRDISIRHTLKEIAKKRRKPHEINSHDIRIFLKEYREPKSDIMLCMDSSGSMGFHGKLIMARLTAAALAKRALKNGDRVGVVTFDDLGRSVLAPTGRESEVLRHITRITSGGNTNIGDGLKCAGDTLKKERSRNRKVIMLVTDGEPTAISERALSSLPKSDKKDMTGEYAVLEARRASSAGIETSVVHITDTKGAGKKLVDGIAKAGHGDVKCVVRPEDLKALMLS
ncbi:MAG: VWA domain-containing protein [Dehalococcoidales bacterium]|nr:VWA domain-containing protein [Dehalococcoidales bacterium]